MSGSRHVSCQDISGRKVSHFTNFLPKENWKLYTSSDKVGQFGKLEASMQVNDIFQDKTLKQKTKVMMLSNFLMDKKIRLDDLINFAEKANETEKATCIESIEFTTKKQPAIATEECLKFIKKSLTDNAPRIKWESAKVIGNIASSFPTKLKPVIKELLINSEYSGTVVRWATAYALGEILKLKTDLNKELIPTIEAISAREEDTGVKKKYLDALKKVKK